jgi:hypothetical protein
MSRGKYLSLEEARRTGQLERFAKEHPSEANRARAEELKRFIVRARKRSHSEAPSPTLLKRCPHVEISMDERDANGQKLPYCFRQ